MREREYETISVVNGHIRFNTLKDLHDFVDYAKKTDDLVYKEKIKKFETEGFISLQYNRQEHDEALMLRMEERKIAELEKYYVNSPVTRIKEFEIQDENE